MRFNKVSTWWEKGRVSFFICGFIILYLLKFTWLKWGDLIIDTGREAYIPWALTKGKILYKDIFYLYGPFSPYFNAFLFKIFGPHIQSLILSGIITTCLCSVLIYKISRVFLNIFIATFTTITFLFVFAFGDYYYAGIFNFILPYSYSAIHSVLFSLFSLYFFYLWLKEKSRIYTYLCALFLTLALLCRIEVGLFILSAFIAGLRAYFFKNKAHADKKDIAAYLLIFIACPVFLAFIVYYVFFILSKDMLVKSNLLDVFFSNVSFNSLITRTLFGAGDILKSILIIGKSFLYYVFLCSFFILGGFIVNDIYKFKKNLIKWICIFFISVIFLSIEYMFVKQFFTPDLQYRILPLICLVMAVVFLWKFINDSKDIGYIFIGTLSLFSFFLTFRMFFNAWAGHFGFYILVPALIIYYIFFLRIILDFLKPNSVRYFFMGCWIFLSALFIINHFAVSKFFYQNRTLKISSKRGGLYVFNSNRDYKCKELIEFLTKDTGERETVAIFPEGLFINFLSKRENPLYYYQYLPMDLARESIEDGIIKDIENKKIDYIVINQRGTYEYGYVAFGYDYGRKIFDYIVNNYRLYKQFGPFPFSSNDYGIALFKRKI